MRSPWYGVKSSPVVLAAVILLFSLTAFAQTAPPVTNSPASLGEINMLVLGDSILWGQGLKEEHKSWYLVKTWLQESAAVPVRERVEAHAGAVIGVEGTAPPKSLKLFGEISSAWPTLHDQIDDALRATDDPSKIDLVLVMAASTTSTRAGSSMQPIRPTESKHWRRKSAARPSKRY